MLVSIWLTMFVIACATLHQTLTRRLPVILGAMFGFLLWILLALGALDLVVVDGGSVAFTETAEYLSFLCIGGIVVNVGLLFASFTGQLPTGRPSERSEM